MAVGLFTYCRVTTLLFYDAVIEKQNALPTSPVFFLLAGVIRP